VGRAGVSQHDTSFQMLGASSCGTLYGIGVGPGDPGLLTLKAFRALEQSDLVVAPRSAPNKESMALEIVSKAFEIYGKASEMPEVSYVTFPMKEADIQRDKTEKEINEKIVQPLRQGLNVSFVTIGDPFLYSTYRQLKKCLAQFKPFETIHIPGVFSFSAVSAHLGKELTSGLDKLAVIPVEKGGDYSRDLSNYSTVVFLKVTSDLPQVIKQIKSAGRLPEAVLVEKVGMEGERVYRDLSGLNPSQMEQISYLSTLIVYPSEVENVSKYS